MSKTCISLLLSSISSFVLCGPHRSVTPTRVHYTPKSSSQSRCECDKSANLLSRISALEDSLSEMRAYVDRQHRTFMDTLERYVGREAPPYTASCDDLNILLPLRTIIDWNRLNTMVGVHGTALVRITTIFVFLCLFYVVLYIFRQQV